MPPEAERDVQTSLGRRAFPVDCRIWETNPNTGSMIMYTSGWPKTQNRCWVTGSTGVGVLQHKARRHGAESNIRVVMRRHYSGRRNGCGLKPPAFFKETSDSSAIRNSDRAFRRRRGWLPDLRPRASHASYSPPPLRITCVDYRGHTCDPPTT